MTPEHIHTNIKDSFQTLTIITNIMIYEKSILCTHFSIIDIRYSHKSYNDVSYLVDTVSFPVISCRRLGYVLTKVDNTDFYYVVEYLKF